MNTFWTHSQTPFATRTTRATADDYKEMNKSPFVRVLSRGHMAPAGDTKSSQAAMDATFLLGSNIVPQVRLYIPQLGP